MPLLFYQLTDTTRGTRERVKLLNDGRDQGCAEKTVKSFVTFRSAMFRASCQDGFRETEQEMVYSGTSAVWGTGGTALAARSSVRRR